MSISVEKVDSFSRLGPILKRHPDIIVISPGADTAAGKPHFLKFDFLSPSGGFHRMRWIYNPEFHSTARNRFFKALFDMVSDGGAILITSVHPGKTIHLSHVSEMLASFDSYNSTDDEQKFLRECENLWRYLQPCKTSVPLAAGYREDNAGALLPYCDNGSQVVWTRHWNPVYDIIEPTLSQWLQSNIDVSDWNNFLAYSNATNTDMFNSKAACDSFGGSDDALVLDRSYNWPVAFAARFGNGAVMVLPENADIGMILSDIRYTARHKKSTGWDLAKDYWDSLNGDDGVIVIRISGLPSSTRGSCSLRDSTKVSYRVTAGGVTWTVTVTALCLIKFLVVWLASELGMGVAFLSRKQMEDLGKKTSSPMLAVSETKLVTLPGGSVLRSDSANIDADLTDAVNTAVFGRREITGEEHALIYGGKKRSGLAISCGYSVRSLSNIRISPSDTFVSQMKKFKFAVSSHGTPPHREYKEFNESKNKKRFLKQLLTALA